MMVTEEIRFFVDNIMNKGNMLGLDKASLDVYFTTGLKSDEKPDILLQVDTYTAFGGFLEALILKMEKDAEQGDVGGAEWVINEYRVFVDDIKKYEGEIIKHTKKYFDKINNIAESIRKLGRNVRIHVSEISTGVELYFSGRYEILRNHIVRKINELSAEGIEDVVVLSPFEYSLYVKRYLSQLTMAPFNFKFYLDFVRKNVERIRVPDGKKIVIFEPYSAPISLFPPDVRDFAMGLLLRIEDLLMKIDGVSVERKEYDGPPIGYEQLWMINPLVAVSMARSILSRYSDMVVVTYRTSTAMILNVARELYGIDVDVYDYADFISRVVLGAEL